MGPSIWDGTRWQSVVDTSGPVEELSIPVGDVLPAQRTGRMTFNGNLDAAGTLIQGTIRKPNRS
jgi:hypothetical protein